MNGNQISRIDGTIKEAAIMPDGSGRIVISVHAYQLANWPRNPINSDVTIVSEWDFRNLCLKSEEGSAAPAGKKNN